MKNCNAINLIAVILLLVGGINWGLVGLFDFNLVMAIFGMAISRVLFVVIGIAAVYRIICLVRGKHCSK